MKNVPATPLPWIAYAMGDRIEVYQDDGKGNGDEINVTTRDGQPNAAYITHAANAYPRLVAAIKDDLRGYLGDFPKGHAATKLRDLLRDLGESE